MSDPKPLDITIYSETPPPGFADPDSRGWQFDKGFVARQQAREDAEWAAAVAGMNEPQPGDAGGKSPVVEGAKTGAQSFVEGGKLAAEGLAEITMGSKEGPLGPLGHGTPVNPMGSLKKVFDGLMSMGLSPFVALGAGAGQALENENPELAAKPFATGSEALNYRAFLAMKAPKDLTPEERTAMSQPMTVREALETAVTLAGPALAGKAPGALKKAGEFNKKLGERGSVGTENATGAATPPPPGGGAPPPGGASSPFAEGPKPRVNLQRINAEQAVKDLIAELNVKAQQEGKISDRVVSRAETASKAQAKKLTVDEALALDYSELHVNAQGLRDLRDLVVTELNRMRRDKSVPAAQTARMADIAGALEAKASTTSTDIARALGAHNTSSDAARATFGEGKLAELAERRKAQGITDEEYVARINKLETRAQRMVFLRGLVSTAVRGQNMFYEAWINGLLSNPVTHAGNVASNHMMASWGIAERQIGGMFNLIARESDGYHIGEAAVMFRAQNRAAASAFRVAVKALVEGEGPFGADKMEIKPSITSTGTWLEGTPVAGTLDFLGSGVRIPSRLLMTEDALYKWFNYTLDMEARAYREGKNQGLTGDALAEFRRNFIRENELSGSPADVGAQEYAAINTFTRDLDAATSGAGKVSYLVGGIQKLPLVGRLIAPFNRTPVNIGAEAWRRTPGLSLISESFYRDLFGDNAAKRDAAVARFGTSMMLAMIFMEYSGAGLMTGGGVEKGDAKAALKELGRQDYAVHVGDSLYTINRLDPAGMTLGILASYAEIAGQIPEGRRLEFAVAMALAMSEAIKDKPYFMGLATVIEAVENPTAGSKKILENYTRSLIPAGVRQVRKSGIPGLVDEDKARRNTHALTEVEELLNTLKADVPGYSRTLPAMRNPVTGEPIVYPPGWGPDLLSPVLVTKLKNDPVFVEIARNKPALRDVPKALVGRVPSGLQMTPDAETAQGIPLTAQEMDRFAVLMARVVTDGNGRNLHQAMTDLVQSPEYQALETGKGGGRHTQLERVYRVFWKAAYDRMRDEFPEIDEAIRTKLEQRLTKKVGEGQQPKGFQIAPGLVLPGRTP